MDEIRLLTSDEIDVRVAQTNTYNNNGQLVVKVNLLLYKDARCDMRILDELYTPMGWKRSHRLIGDRLYCTVEIWDNEKKEWVGKEDVGVESNTEAEKGQASDSFKRACFNWGIGRELYTAPKISVELNDREYTKDQSNRIKVCASFSVKSIGYDKMTRTITSLEIVDKAGHVRFSMGSAAAAVQPEDKPVESKAVKARRTAAMRNQEQPKPEQKQEEELPPYNPVEQSAYWAIVKAYAEGRKTKTGGDYRETWAVTTHAREEQILQFDRDVDNYRANNIF